MYIVALTLSPLLIPALSWGDMEQFTRELNKLPPAERQKKLVEGAKKERKLCSIALPAWKKCGL
jgi:hypothetical protein